MIAQLTRRPFCPRRKIAIPFVTLVPEDGSRIAFAIEDRARVVECARKHLCQLCGLALDAVLVFVGGETATRLRIFRQAPFHEPCARYAVRACPYLRNTDDRQFATLLPPLHLSGVRVSAHGAGPEYAHEGVRGARDHPGGAGRQVGKRVSRKQTRTSAAFVQAARSKWEFSAYDLASETEQSHRRDNLCAEIKARMAAKQAALRPLGQRKPTVD